MGRKKSLKRLKERDRNKNRNNNWGRDEVIPSPSLKLTNKQQLVYENLKTFVLLDSTRNFGEIYSSGLSIIESRYASRFSMSAHCFREIMEKLPEAISGVRATVSNNDRDAVKKIRIEWDDTVLAPTWNDLKWKDKVIDVPMDTFLKSFQVFHRAGVMNGPTRRDLKERLIRYLHKHQAGLSTAFENTLVQRWTRIEIYMKSVAHNAETTEEKFLEYKNHFDELLYDLFKQPSLDTLDEIEKMIRAGEGR